MSPTALDFTTFGLAVGRWIKPGDGDNAGQSFATAACNGFCRISAVGAQAILRRGAGGMVADTGAGVALRAIGDAVVNGSVLRTINVFSVDAKQAAIAI